MLLSQHDETLKSLACQWFFLWVFPFFFIVWNEDNQENLFHSFSFSMRMYYLIANYLTLPTAVMKSSWITNLQLVSGSHQPKKSMLYPGLKPDGKRSQKLEDNDDTDLLVTSRKRQVDNIKCLLKNGSATNACSFWRAHTEAHCTAELGQDSMSSKLLLSDS